MTTIQIRPDARRGALRRPVRPTSSVTDPSPAPSTPADRPGATVDPHTAPPATVAGQGRLAVVRAAIRDGDDVGMATAEYAIATVAAAGFAGILIALLRSDEVRGLLMGIVRSALSM